jgi:hypothetical protein
MFVSSSILGSLSHVAVLGVGFGLVWQMKFWPAFIYPAKASKTQLIMDKTQTNIWH